MMIVIDIESSTVETRNKKSGGTYQVQEAFAHLTDLHGNPRRYPERINLFPPRNQQGQVIPYQPGHYVLAPQSFRVVNGYLELGFPVLVPLEQATKKAG